jgi:hypothetical protein
VQHLPAAAPEEDGGGSFEECAGQEGRERRRENLRVKEAGGHGGVNGGSREVDRDLECAGDFASKSICLVRPPKILFE